MRKRLLSAGVLVAAIGAVAVTIWTRLPAQSGDPDFVPRDRPAAFTAAAPSLLIDRGHVNFHTADGRYAPFARLARAAGFRVDGADGWHERALGTDTVLVVANAMGYTGALDQAAAILGLDRFVNLTRSAFTDEEIARAASWVRDGGSLLLVADHRPMGAASARLARAFDVEMTNGYVADATHHDERSPTFLTFTAENGLLGDHDILRGRTASEQVRAVTTFTGQALRANGATPLLRLSPTASERAGRYSGAPTTSVGGLAQAVALEHGKGRVVILGEAAVLTSQIVGPGDAPLRMGLQWPGTDNEQFVTNILHWLARVPMDAPAASNP